MSKPAKIVTELRRELKPRVDFAFFVRQWRDGTLWVGPDYGSDKRMAALCSALTDLGYSFECNGTPGTSGEHIIDVHVPTA
jgi:hypothetical protein